MFLPPAIFGNNYYKLLKYFVRPLTLTRSNNVVWSQLRINGLSNSNENNSMLTMD